MMVLVICTSAAQGNPAETNNAHEKIVNERCKNCRVIMSAQTSVVVIGYTGSGKAILYYTTTVVVDE